MSTKSKTVLFFGALLGVVLTACGGGSGGGVRSDGSPADITTHTPYSVSVNRGSIGTTPVIVSDDGDVITIGSRTITGTDATLLTEYDVSGGYSHLHFRAFDAPGATSGPALEFHILGGYDYFALGAWAEGEVSPNPGFRIGETFGAYFLPDEGLTPVPNLPTTGLATWRGHYAGYVDREGVGVSQVVGRAEITASFYSPSVYGSSGAIVVELLPPDPVRSSFAAPPPQLCVVACTTLEYDDRVLMGGPIDGATFESDVTATRTLAGQTIPRGDMINVISSTNSLGGYRTLYSTGSAHSGGMQGGFFGNRGSGSGGTYQFTIGTTKAVGSFGGILQ